MTIRHSPPVLRLAHVVAAEPYAAKEGVSAVARSPRGFVAAYKLASGDWTAMGRDAFSGELWETRRANFIARHMKQAKRGGEKFWTPSGFPTRRHLALIMWAYTPTPRRTAKWLGEIRRSR